MGCLNFVIAVIVGLVAEGMIAGSSFGLFGLIVASMVLTTLNERGKKNKEEHASTSDIDVTLSNMLVQVVMRPAGSCPKCKRQSLWKFAYTFESSNTMLSVCEHCDPETTGDLPQVLPADSSRTRIIVKPAGHCLKCGRDALWSHTYFSAESTDNVLFCSNCEPHLTGLAPFSRTEKDLPEEPSGPNPVCPKCKHVNIPDARFCTQCGFATGMQ